MSLPFWRRQQPPLPPLSGDMQTQICVVGLGVSGLSAIRKLSQYNRQVVGLDIQNLGAGASGRNGGFLLAGSADFYHELRKRVGRTGAQSLYDLTLSARDRIAAEEPSYAPIGSLRLPASPEERVDCEEQLEALHEDGFPAQWIKNVDEHRSGLLIPGDGTFDPGARCHTLAQSILGQAQLFRASVNTINYESVLTSSGHVKAEHILVCVDGGLNSLIPSLTPRVRSLRLQMLATEPAHDTRIRHAVYHRFGFDYWQQRPDGRITLGGARDIGQEEENTQELATTSQVQNALEYLLRSTIKTQAAITHRWAGIVGYTSNNLPIAEEIVSVGPRVYAAGGYSGHGNVLCAIAGEALADLAMGRPKPPLIRWLEQYSSVPD